MWVKKIGWKILPKDGKSMRPVRIFGILAVRELPFCLRYRSLGLLMPDNHQSPIKTKAQTTILNYTFLVFNRALSPLDGVTNPKYKLSYFLTTIFLPRDVGTNF